MKDLPSPSKPLRTLPIDQIFDAVRESVINGQVPVRDFHSSEGELPVQCGGGRHPRREAIRTLEYAGVVMWVQGRGSQGIDQSASISVNMLKLKIGAIEVAPAILLPAASQPPI
jgi:DNA-binding FadR family transcriptional regulator